jgi:hypothetical protein
MSWPPDNHNGGQVALDGWKLFESSANSGGYDIVELHMVFTEELDCTQEFRILPRGSGQNPLVSMPMATNMYE